ncbi:MAG: aromatic amino acid hydroxylase [Bdellovibrionota bacterium]
MDSQKNLPENLKVYIAQQDYSKYTSRDQASWRYIMRQNRSFFSKYGHPVYLEGLKKTGISISSIPKISDMDEKLKEFGWGAVCVRGFIPPAAFLEFQARNLLPIATDMRTLEHIAYTPAPDIVHEAAGHAPIIADPAYANYLSKYAQLARKAIYSSEDIKLFEAIRELSDIKENPDASQEQIDRCEKNLQNAVQSISFVSESAKVTRMYWWTAEYGLVENAGQLCIYGAGLLSSVDEGQKSLLNSVKKIPITLDCINQEFDITEPQPQLFVAKDFCQLSSLLDELESSMAFKVGGLKALETAKKAKALTTTALDSKIGISGILEEYISLANKTRQTETASQTQGKRDSSNKEQIIFIRWSGPTQLSFNEKELEGHGRNRHPEGFSTPIGFWKGIPTPPQNLSDTELKQFGLSIGEQCSLEFNSGFKVEGKIKGFLRQKDKLLLITWTSCTVSYAGQTYFKPEWGEFDMAVGTEIPSVYGGPADFQRYGEQNLGELKSQPGRTSPYSKKELRLFDLYQKIRDLREQGIAAANLPELKEVALETIKTYGYEWLLAVEVLELVQHILPLPDDDVEWVHTLEHDMLDLAKYDAVTQSLIRNGLKEAKVLD